MKRSELIWWALLAVSLNLITWPSVIYVVLWLCQHVVVH